MITSWQEEVYDGEGNHLGGIYPPIATDRGCALTDAYHQSKALRPLSQLIAHRLPEEGPELGMVWMLPVGMKADDHIPDDVLGAAVWLIDQDKSVIIHADDADALRVVTIVACRFTGGGHA